jgi:hypothetical protein
MAQTQEKENPKNRRKSLYQELVKSGDYTGTLDEFESDYSDEKNLKDVLYAGLKESGDVTDTSYEDFANHYFGDVVKKKIQIPGIPDPSMERQDPYTKHLGTLSGKSSSKVSAPTAESQSNNHQNPISSRAGSGGAGGKFLDDQVRVKKARIDAVKNKEEETKKLSTFYDKTHGSLAAYPTTEDATMALYKTYAAENGSGDRINYLEEKAKSEQSDEASALSRYNELLSKFKEEKTKAESSGDKDKVKKLDELIRANEKEIASRQQYNTKGRSETDLQLWEEASGFRAKLLNTKIEELLKNPETTEKLKRLEALNGELKKNPDNVKAVEEYNSILAEDDIAQVNKIAGQGSELINTEKGLAVKFPKQFAERLEKKSHQAEVDKMFSSGEKGMTSGVMNQLGRSATNLVADLVKLPAVVDYDNSYGWQDKLKDTVDSVTGYVDSELLPTPSSYNTPLIYKDEKGNSVFRSDLLLPKIAKMGGDMAALYLGAGKLAGLGKAAGLSTKVSQGIGLFSSSYVQTYNDYKKAGEDAGMSPQEAAVFATTSAGTASALELISPQKYLWGGGALESAKRVVKSISTGTGVKEASRVAVKDVFKDILGENAQELSQLLGDKAIEAGANKVLGGDYFEQNKEDIINESLETMVLTSILSGVTATGSGISQIANREKNYKDAIRMVAENKEKYLPLLQSAFKSDGVAPDKVKSILEDINKVNVPLNGAPLYMINDVPVPRTEIEALIKSGKPLENVYVANDEQLENQLQAGPQESAKEETPVKEEPTAEAEDIEEESGQDKAKRVAKEKMAALAQAGVIAYDGKRATSLTKDGGNQVREIMSEMNAAIAAADAAPKKVKGKKVGEHNGSKILDTTDVKAYHKGMAAAVANRPQDGVQVEVKSEEDLQGIIDEGGKLLLSEDGNFGGYVKKDGYMGGLFKDPSAKTSGVAKTLQDLRVKAGGRYFDAFGTKLEDIYIKNGFRPVARLPFNEEFAPEGWQNTDLKSKPDVVFFAYDPKGTYKKGDGLHLENWDEATNLTKHFVKAHEKANAGRIREGVKGTGLHETPVVDSKNVPKEGADDDRKNAGVSGLGGKTSQGSKAAFQIEGDNLDLKEVAKTSTDPETKRIATILTKAKTTLSSIKPGIRIAFYKGEQQGSELLASLKSKATSSAGKSGFYDESSNVIGIDLDAADATTAFHEAFHPIVDAVRVANPELFKALAQEASEARLELADGKIVSYQEYAGGNKEEALVEFLADFADGRFDKFNSPSLIQKVKSIINKILEAVGLKPSDFRINTNNIESLKSLADGLATAISQGKTVNVGKRVAPATKGKTKFQTKGAKKKLNRTAEKIAMDKATEFKALQTDIIKDPDAYSYEPQDLKSKKQIDSNMTMDELVVETQSADRLLDAINQDNQYAVLSAIELIRRKNALGEDTRPIFKKLREIGTGVGQLLRQFAELKNHSSEGIVHTVLGNLESLNLTLTEPQMKELEKLAAENFSAVNEREAKRVELIQNPSKQNEEKLKAADKIKDESFHKLNQFIGRVTPLGVDSMIGTILQGNLLTTKSIVVNVASNIIQQPFRLAELIAGDIATYMVTRFKGQNMMNPLEMYFSSTLNGIQGFGNGSIDAIMDIAKGKGAENSATLEVRRNLKPMQALWQLVTKSGRASLPVNAKGNVPVSVLLEKALEGTAGWPAEAMFRMLYLGDKPFKDAARMAGAYRLFAETGKKTNAEFVKFMANLTTAQKKKLQDYSEEATFSNERTLAKTADKFVNFVNHSIDIMADVAPDGPVKHTLHAFAKFVAKANAPFIRVPSNLLQYLLELAVPVLPLYGSYAYARKGDTRKSAQLFVRSAIGASMFYLANMLYDAGVMIASGEGDDDDEKKLKFEIGRPNGINIDALARFYAGTTDQNELFKTGDRVVDFTKLGLFGMYLGFNAELNETIKKDLKKTRSEISTMSLVTEALGAVSKTSLEMSYLQGAYTGLNSLGKGDFTNYFAELGNTMTALIIPNQVSVNTRARGEYLLKADDKETIKKFNEKQSTKIFPQLKDNIAGVYPVIGMFGDAVKQNPDRGTFGDVNPFIYQYLDITNGKEISDPLTVEVYNLSKRVGEIPYSTPSPKVMLDEVTYTLNEQDYVYLQMISGRYKRQDTAYEMAQPEWASYPDEEKHIILSEINDAANKDARESLIDILYEGIDSGNIVVDPETGTYSYKQQSEFDFDYAKKLDE